MKIPDNIPWKATGTTLGQGGQGVVQLVTRKDDTEGRHYALKALNRVNSAQARQRFRSEIEAVKLLDHDAIVPVVDQSEPGDAFQFYVMEYIPDAKPLNRVIFNGTNPYHGDVGQSLALFQKVVEAIQACERANPQIVHRDIKPNNILIVPDGGIRLIDFGICQIQDGAMVTLVDENVGARNYTSPECEGGNAANVGIHSDIYSAGKVLWSAITSRQAFAREEPVFAHLSMQTLFPEQPETWHLSHVFEKTIREDPSNRFQSAQDVANLVGELHQIIQRGFPPVERVHFRCPSCGWRRIDFLPENFSGFDPDRFVSHRCAFCGFTFVRDRVIWRENVDRTQGLR